MECNLAGLSVVHGVDGPGEERGVWRKIPETDFGKWNGGDDVIVLGTVGLNREFVALFTPVH